MVFLGFLPGETAETTITRSGPTPDPDLVDRRTGRVADQDQLPATQFSGTWDDGPGFSYGMNMDHMG